MRGYGRAGVLDAIREAGGEIYAISSEPQTLATAARDDWQTHMVHVGDPHHEIARACAERGWLALFHHDWGGAMVEAITPWASHPKGFFQPGVLALHQTGRVLYRWRSRPDRRNVGGARRRPTATHVWARVEAALAEPPNAPDVLPDANPEYDAPNTPWPLFVALLLANGWFVRPTTFGHRPGENSAGRRQRNAALRLLIFIAAWVAAGLLLPTGAVALAFGAWLLAMLPGIRLVHQRFQNVAPGIEPGG